MPRKHRLVRVERGLYRSGDVYHACATPLGSEKVAWKRLGAAVDPYRLAIATAIFSGLRIGELLGPSWEDIDLKSG